MRTGRRLPRKERVGGSLGSIFVLVEVAEEVEGSLEAQNGNGGLCWTHEVRFYGMMTVL